MPEVRAPKLAATVLISTCLMPFNKNQVLQKIEKKKLTKEILKLKKLISEYKGATEGFLTGAAVEVVRSKDPNLHVLNSKPFSGRGNEKLWYR
jgi:hypothetical protein